jgi:hypothetical protein
MGHDEHGPAYPETPKWRPAGKPRRSHPLKRNPWDLVLSAAFLALALGFLFVLLIGVKPAPAMDHGFDPTNQTVKWFERKMIPNITFQQSCCGKADAYPVARVKRNTNQTWSVWLADGSAIKYPDGTKREPFDENTEIVVPDSKVNPPDDDLDNPTDVGWIFMRVSNPTNPGAIYCLIIHPEGN